MKIAFLYGGQGSQVEGMGSDLYEEYPIAKKYYDEVLCNLKEENLVYPN